ncbi:MAG: CRTAC1 family protein [Planctomycetes bacterium]|nr:CRTAC1 family protein [Planctomycetota bacterium]
MNCFAQSSDPIGFRRSSDSFPDGLRGTRVAMGDVDLDGDPDVLISGRLLLNDGNGTFRLAPQLGCNRSCRAAIFLDYDQDGDLDVFTSGPDRLLRNDLGTDGKPHFRDVSAEVGIQDDGLPGEGLAAGDLNGDGYPDVYLANYESGGVARGTPDRLYLSNGRGGFDLSPEISSRLCGRGVTMGDFDQDGDLDLYVSNYRLQGNLLYVNQLRETGAFSLRYENRGTQGGAAHTIGSTWGDLDGDGSIDLLMGNFSHRGSGWGAQPMVQVCRQRNGYFTPTAGSALGIQWREAHSNPTLFDLDNDGDLDLYLTTTYGRRSDLYRNQVAKSGTLRFHDATERLRAEVNDGWGCAAADVDNDGDQDLVVAVRGGRKPILLRNEQAQRAPKRRSVRVRLRGKASDSWGIGATAILIHSNGTRRTVRQLSMGHGTSSQSEPILHFGVGRAAGPFKVEVRWPSGHVTRSEVKPGSNVIREPKGPAPSRASTGLTWADDNRGP